MKEHRELRSNQRGFTLIELMVALVLSFILIGAIYRGFTSQQKAYTVQDQVAQAQQNARMAMNILLRDIRMAGYGMPDTGITIGSPAKTYSNAIKIKKNDKYGGVDQLFDSITLVGALGAPSGYLSRTLSPGSNELYLRSSDEASNFNNADKKYIFIGGLDSLEVASVSGNKIVLKKKTKVKYPTAILKEDVGAGETDLPVYDASGLDTGDVLSLGKETLFVQSVSSNIITVDTKPATTEFDGIAETYSAGTPINPIPVYRVTAVEYAIDSSWCLTREDKTEGAGAQGLPRLAGDIQDIQITPDDLDDQPYYTVTLIARTKTPDPDYTENNGYRQRVLQSTVALRNF